MEIHSEEDAMKVKVYCLLIVQVVQYMIMVLKVAIQWNLFIMDTLGPAISGSFLLLYRGFPLSEVKVY